VERDGPLVGTDRRDPVVGECRDVRLERGRDIGAAGPRRWTVRVSNLGWSKGDEAKDNPDAKLERSP
jgi:hypothetical protein